MHAAGEPTTERKISFDSEPTSRPPVIGDAIVYPLPAGRYRAEFIKNVRRRTPTTPGQYVVLLRLTRRGECAAVTGG